LGKEKSRGVVVILPPQARALNETVKRIFEEIITSVYQRFRQY